MQLKASPSVLVRRGGGMGGGGISAKGMDAPKAPEADDEGPASEIEGRRGGGRAGGGIADAASEARHLGALREDSRRHGDADGAAGVVVAV